MTANICTGIETRECLADVRIRLVGTNSYHLRSLVHLYAVYQELVRYLVSGSKIRHPHKNRVHQHHALAEELQQVQQAKPGK